MAATAAVAGPVRLAKLLAERGVCSRRQAEAWMAAGRIQVNGRPHRDPAVLVDAAHDRIKIDGRPLPPAPPHTYLLLNKPRFVLSTARDPRGRPTVLQLLPPGLPRLYPVGRLDWDSEGLLLLTNDGDLAYALMHPSRGVRKVYEVEVDRPVTAAALTAWERGVALTEGVTSPARVERLGRERFRIHLHEGRYRQVRRMCAALGYGVRRLVRVAEGNLRLDGLRPGQWRPLSSAELQQLRQEAGL